jgi:aryl-alcohol dehydrogenase-like predicted oxidoreductase
MNNANGDPNVAGNHRKNMVVSLESSLKRLGTDYLDIYWIHARDNFTPVEEMMRALDDLVRAGKVLYVGISNAPAWVIAQANTLADMRGWTPFTGIQVSYSLIERTPERDLIPMASALGLAVTAWAPLASGLLTGKYNEGARSEPRRLDQTQPVKVDERNLGIAAVVLDVAREAGCKPEQVALAWIRQRGAIAILGARTLAQMKGNLASLEVSLSEAQVRRLEEASQIDLGYPHEFLSRPNIVNSVYGGMYAAIDR